MTPGDSPSPPAGDARERMTLLPCPFCGGDATVEPWHGGGPKKRLVSCRNEACDVRPAVCGSMPRRAIERWNTRDPAWHELMAALSQSIAASDALKTENERLRQTVERQREALDAFKEYWRGSPYDIDRSRQIARVEVATAALSAAAPKEDK